MKKILLASFCISLIISCQGQGDNTLASGVFEATEVIVSSQSTGEILFINVAEGDQVKSGQVLGAIDSVQLELKLKQLQAAMDIAESKRPDLDIQLAPLVQQLATAEKEKNRVENLLKVGATNEKQYDDINAQILLMQKQYSAQKDSLEQNNLAIDREIASLVIQKEQIQDQIERCAIKSPMEGTVLLKYAEKGELAVPGKALLKIADTEQMFLRAYITSSLLTRLKIGQSVSVVSDFGESGERTYAGIVTWISQEAEFTPRTIQTRDERSNLVYAVKIAVSNDGFLKIGMYGGIGSVNE